MVQKRKTTTKPRRARQADLLSYLRDPIVAGKLRAGDRLPPQTEIVKKFGSSSLTVRRAFRQFVAQGFARTVPKVGTFVVDHPPHLCRYGIAFVHKRGDSATLFQDAIAAAAEGISRRDPRRQFSFYYEIDGHTDREGYRSLAADLQARRLAGLIFATHPGPLIGSPLLARDGVPRISISSDPRLTALGVSLHGVDAAAFIDRAFTLASQSGARRVAVLWHTNNKSEWQPETDGITDLAAAKNLDLPRRHVQVPAMRDPASIYHCVYGLLDDAPERRPEVLIISDDNLVEEATRAIVQTGVRVPQELRVIAHCNYPKLPSAAVPVVRLGFDIGAMLEQCVGVLDGRRNGQDAQPAGPVPPLLEEELVHLARSPGSGNVSLVAARG